MKNKIICLLSLVILFSSCSKAEENSSGGVIEKTYTYDTDNKSDVQKFPEEITVDGKTYRIMSYRDIDYSEEGSRDVVEIVKDISVEDESEIHKKEKLEYKDTEYEFSLYKSEVTPAMIKKTVTTQADYENQLVTPSDIPKQTDVDVFIGNEKKTYTGILSGVEQLTEFSWKDNLIIQGLWTGDIRASTFNLSGTDITVPYNREKPEWTGYRSDILKSMKLSEKSYRITDCYWKGDAYSDQNGNFRRNAVYTGQQYAADFRRTYTVTYETMGFSGKAYYWADADKVKDSEQDKKTVYSIKAIVKYKLVETAG